ncbi:hypothetical protein CR152_25550 [Massilia violaceinigra]|uniref:MSHA biogenesis protein MshJ n=1 Tax=Massilia violaceinigra TaxID=2045208 RepID=A0A2D2DR88_9BURK|nr:type II secretion system protein GspM [Massilia violaceinigra]ATQ77492.1 hypothetical protein CR152_25550 [Massilia violaceinigra]
MKARLLKLQLKIDAMSVRERAMVFGATVGVIVFIMFAMLIDPLFARQKTLRNQISQQQNNMQGIDAEITAMVQAHAADPDLASKARLAAIRNASATLSNQLRTAHSSLVAPERIAPLLESILKSNGRLRLVGLKSLPVTSFDGSFDAAPAPAGAEPAAPATASPAVASPAIPSRAIYAHGVEVTVRGNYLDMVNYMDALEAMPLQLYWGAAQMEVDTYPEARLSLTLYTLSLDKKWMTL